MKHYVHLKFQPCSEKSDLLVSIENALEQARSTIEGFSRYEILKAKEWSEEHPRLMLVLEFAHTAALKNYLEHSLHTVLLNTVKPYLVDKAIFDGLI